MYNSAKISFKFRNQIRLDIALEALKQGLRDTKAIYSEILEYDTIFRVENVISLYIETICHE
ncbi:MAG: hypothetical protein U5K69_12730 [Balneolaceae bacterium]|nr:hypothetical protein [Balneolaceae bacterium]